MTYFLAKSLENLQKDFHREIFVHTKCGLVRIKGSGVKNGRGGGGGEKFAIFHWRGEAIVIEVIGGGTKWR